MTDPAPGETLVVDIAIGDIETVLEPRLLLSANSDADLYPPVAINQASFTLDPYVVVDGRPVLDVGGARIDTSAGVEGYTKVTTPLDPTTIDIGSWARWLPLVPSLAPPANGGRRWYPQGWAQDNTSPRMSLTSIVPVGAGGVTTGRGTYGPPSPGIDTGYVYEGFGRKMQRPAMVFDGMSVATIDPTTSFTSCTFGLVAVFRPTTLPYYGIFEAASGGFGEPLAYRYSHGRIDMFQNESRVLSHETIKPAQYPVILLVSMDAQTDTGRMLCLDQTRTSRVFNVVNLDFVSMVGIVGALGQGTTASPWRYGSNMDVLELDIWNSALDFPAMEAAANLLSLAYGVSA